MTVDVRALLPRDELGERQGVDAEEAKAERGVPAPGKLSHSSSGGSLHALRT